MKKYLMILCGLVIFAPLQNLPVQANEKNQCVILLHGLGRTKHSMEEIEKTLSRNGYRVWNETYPSTKEKIETLAVSHIGTGLSYCNGSGPLKIHFVTHSLGGILVRFYLQDRNVPNLGNIVMLSPPNKGSEAADYLKDTFLYQIITGPAGQQLGTGPDSIPKKINAIEGTIGIISGEKSYDPWFSVIIPGKDDGKVSVESAKLDEMSDFLVVESGHTFIMRDKSVISQILFFLENGKFQR